MGVPLNHPFWWFFPYKPTIWGIPMYGNTHEWWECHQAFLQLDVNRLVLYRQLLVIDVKDAPCTLRRPVSEMFMPIGRSNTISIREMNCWNHSLWTWQRLYMTLRIWIQTTWFHHELVLRFLLISASHVDIPATGHPSRYLLFAQLAVTKVNPKSWNSPNSQRHPTKVIVLQCFTKRTLWILLQKLPHNGLAALATAVRSARAMRNRVQLNSDAQWPHEATFSQISI